MIIFEFQEKDLEMARLQQAIRECTKPIEHAPKIADQSDFSIFVEPATCLDVVGVKHEESDTEYPTVTVKVVTVTVNVLRSANCLNGA